jgi:hypothetical protein
LNRGLLISPRPASILLLYAAVQSGALVGSGSFATVAASSRTVSESVVAEGGAAEQIRLDTSVATSLRDLEMNETVRLASWPVAPGVKRTLRLARYDVYAPMARVMKVENGREVELPRSALRFFSGTAEGDFGSRALLVLDPRTDEVTALTETASGAYELRAAIAKGRPQTLSSRASSAYLEGPAQIDCKATCSPLLSSEVSALRVSAPLTSLHTATIAIDTDNELMLNNFGDNTVAATDFLAQMFAALNLIYERDHMVRLLQGTTFLRVSTTPDPYNNVEDSLSMQLGEVHVHWNNNHSGVQRAQVMMISGLPTGPGSGLSGVNTLCQGSASVGRIPGTTNPLAAVPLVGHELGHAFGAIHTHCAYNVGQDPSDKCWNGESSRSGCWAGAQSCPAPTTINGVPNVQGTIMSYCFRIGCSQTNVFHPDSSNAISQALANKVGVCVFDTVTRFSIEGEGVPEGHSGNTLLPFTIKLSAPSTTDLSVAFAVSGGTATVGTDFVTRSGRFTIPAGTTSKKVVLVVTGDTTVEADETVQVTLSDPSSGAVIDGTKSVASSTISNDDPVTVAATILQYRVYHDGTKEHLFTTDANEYNVLGTRGWTQEGPAYTMFSNTGTSGGTNTVPFFRLYHPGTQQHLWTTDFNEALTLSDFTTWSYEGIIGYLLPTSGTGTVPLYRMNLPNPPIHLWTTDLNEYTVLQGRGWVAEGVVGHVKP